MPLIKFVAEEANATNLPSCDREDSSLVWLPGVTPSGELINVVPGTQVPPAVARVVRHVDLSKISGFPLNSGLSAPPLPTRFLAVELKETKSPSLEIAGWELCPSPGTGVGEPFAAETKYVTGVQPEPALGGTTLHVLRT